MKLEKKDKELKSK